MPNRILKESICTSEEIDKLTWFEEVFFNRLIVNCDDFGRFDGRAAIIRGKLFPLKSSMTDKTIQSAINKLATVGLVISYLYDDKPYLQLVTWEKHQQRRAKNSKYPSPPHLSCKQLISSDINCIQMSPYSRTETNTNTTSEPSSDSSQNSKPKKPTYDSDSKHYKASIWLADDIRKKHENCRAITEDHLQAWADEFRKLEMLDKVDWANIRETLVFAREDQFWEANILSGTKFRKQYDAIRAKLDNAGKHESQKAGAEPYTLKELK